MKQLLVAMFCAIMASPALAPGAAAQDTPSADANRAVTLPTTRWVPARDSRAQPLQRRIQLDLTNVQLATALEAIGRRAGLKIGYSGDVRRAPARVTLKGDSLTVIVALMRVLEGTGFEPFMSMRGDAVLVSGGIARALIATGSIAGRVTDAKTGDRLTGAEVMVDGTRWRTTSGENGHFRIADIEAGTYTVTVRRVGYARQSRQVTVIGEQEVTADVALQPVVTQLNEIVTTVTGEQRRLELGHVVGVINADSVVKEAPISSLSELLNGRVTGLQVFQTQGTVGGTVSLQSRGANSLLLNLQPIVIIDGTRYSNLNLREALPPYPFGSNEGERTSPLNDLNPNDIESIEVVKGPSAATLYGTDAANGVIVITTKRGRNGPSQWRAYVRAARSEIPIQRFPDNYWGWSAQGSTGPYPFSCTLRRQAEGACVQDSVTTLLNAMSDPQYSMFGPAPRRDLGVNVSGGRQDLRYYFSGLAEDADGPIRTPPALLDQVRAQRGGTVSDQLLHPNTLSKATVRANVTAAAGDKLELRANSGYIRSTTRSLEGGPYYVATVYADPGRPYGYGYWSPEQMFSFNSVEKNDRYLAGGNAHWQPTPWLQAKANVGVDVANRNRNDLIRRDESPNYRATGRVEDDRYHQLATTADLGLTAVARRGRMTARTSVGAQYVRNLNDGLESYGQDLPPGGTSVGEAAIVYTRQSYTETVTLGSYIEETLGFNDRLFLTGALRMDGASAFGQNYDATVYPKASVSWLVSEEPFMPRVPGLDELRVRYAYGASGQQPQPSWARPSFQPRNIYVNGQSFTGLRLTSFGNPDLRPERVREHEIGFDATALTGKLQVGLTWYRRRTVDQIVNRALPQGMWSIATNLGLTGQHGFEAEVTAHALDRRSVSLDFIYHHSLARTKVLDLGGSIERSYPSGGYVEGYPIGARFNYAIVGYTDLNGDGIIVPSEVQLSAERVYVGESRPPRTQTLASMVGLFDRRVRLSALLERRSDYTQISGTFRSHCQGGLCRAAVDPSTPLAEQARAAAYSLNSYYDKIQAGDLTRLREISVAADLPANLIRAMRLNSATLSLSTRNVALWTDFDEPDPESGAGAVPQSRSWTLRLDLGF